MINDVKNILELEIKGKTVKKDELNILKKITNANNDTKDLIRRMVPYDKPAGKYLSSIEEHSRQVIASQQKAFEESEAQFIAAKKRRKERAKKHLEREKLKKKKLKNL